MKQIKFSYFTIIFILLLFITHLKANENNSIKDRKAASSITQYGITWHFDKEYEVGQFANGDYWVLGPVTIIRITPDFNGNDYGWEVNPIVDGSQGFCSSCYPNVTTFDASLVPNLPYIAQANQSLLKTIPSGEDRPCIRTASVLTILGEIPPDNGASVFRPPYVGTEKPLISISSLKTDLLPSFSEVENTPALDWVQERYSKVQLDHKRGGLGRALHPSEHMPDYGGDIGRDNGDAALRLMLGSA